MSEVYLMKRNGSTALNFQIIGGIEKPINPKENTIWVNTDVEINEWIFAAEQPMNPTEGMAWFMTASMNYTITFNALKTNSLIIYPNVCRQYINNVWVDKVAEIYQNNSWIKSNYTYLYNRGSLYTDLTGGWEYKTGAWQGANNGQPTITYNIDNIHIKHINGNISWGYAGVNAISLIGYKKLVMVANIISYREGDGLAIWESNPKTIAAGTTFNKTGLQEIELDISSLGSGNYYVGYRGSTGNSSTHEIMVYEWRLEK